jgi:elongator complex protein 3
MLVSEYQTSVGLEKFLQFVTPENRILGFLRLSLPSKSAKPPFIEELQNCAVIREVHVYGLMTQLGKRDQKLPQHLGLGTKLIEMAQKIATKAGYEKLAVISAIGTREYYRKLGFTDGELYQFLEGLGRNFS